MGTIIIFGVPLIIWLGCMIAAYYRVHNFKPKSNNRFLRLLAYALHFIIVMFSGVIMYQSVIDYLALPDQLGVMVAMWISLASEGISKAIIKVSNDYTVVKNWILEVIKRVCGF